MSYPKETYTLESARPAAVEPASDQLLETATKLLFEISAIIEQSNMQLNGLLRETFGGDRGCAMSIGNRAVPTEGAPAPRATAVIDGLKVVLGQAIDLQTDVRELADRL